MNIKKLIKKILLAFRPPLVYRSPPYFRDTKACNIILAENEQLVNENLYLTEKVKRSGNDVSKLTEALNDCYSTIAALENGNAALKRRNVVLTQRLKNENKRSEFIGLLDRNETRIYAGCKFKCNADFCPGNGELIGIIRWAKYKAGYTLWELNGEKTIACFRSPPGFGVGEIKEMPDGRIDGVVVEE